MSGASKGGISIKTKIFAVLAVAFMMAAAFVGVASITGSDDSDASSTIIINEASSGVDYIPEIINISYGGTVTFTPTVNWAEGTYDSNYTVETVVTKTDVSGVTISVNSTTDAVTVQAGSTTITGGSFTVTSTTTIEYNGVEIATRSTSQDVTLNVYPDMEVDAAVDCYFGVALNAPLVSEGSGNYAVTIVEGDVDNEMLPDGLYILGNNLGGYATIDSFDVTTYTVSAVVVDKVTGAKTTQDVVITMHLSAVSGVITGTGSDPQTIGDNGTVYVDQSSGSAAVTITFTSVQNYTPVIEKVYVDGDLLTEDDDTPSITDYTFSVSSTTYYGTLDFLIPLYVTGTHAVTVDYNVGGYTQTFTFYFVVLESGATFIIPDPNIVISVTG